MRWYAWLAVASLVGLVALLLLALGYGMAASEACRDRGGVLVESVCLNPDAILPQPKN